MTRGRQRHPFLTEGRPDVLAHRGASGLCPPGNTIEAFRRSIELGVDHLETDVQATSDGVVVIFHDDRLDDVTTGSGRVADHEWDVLRTFRYLDGTTPIDSGIVRLDEALETFPEAWFNIDVKTDDAVDATAEILRRHDASDRVCIAAFGWRRLRRLRRALGAGWCSSLSGPEIAWARLLAWVGLPARVPGDVAQVPRRSGPVRVVDRRFVDACHRADVDVHVWTVNDEAQMRELRELGVDAVITDRPDIATRLHRE